MSWLSCNLSVTMLLVISIRFSSVPILGCLVLISNVIRNRHSQTSLLVRDIRRISPGCHLQSSVCKHPSPVSVLRRLLFSLFIGYFFCMRFSRYVTWQQLLLSPNGDGEIRTLAPLLARQVLSQLSYTPIPGNIHFPVACFKTNGLKWTRSTDLTLIRRAL